MIARTFRGFPELLMFLRTAEMSAQAVQQAGMKAAGKFLVEEARAEIGTEDQAWPPLAPSTVAEKDRLGYTGRVSATDPLLRTGELRDSIESAVDDRGVVLGSTDPVMVFHELGTERMPPRPVLATTMLRHGDYATEIVAGHVVAAVAGLDAPLKPRRRREGR